MRQLSRCGWSEHPESWAVSGYLPRSAFLSKSMVYLYFSALYSPAQNEISRGYSLLWVKSVPDCLHQVSSRITTLLQPPDPKSEKCQPNSQPARSQVTT